MIGLSKPLVQTALLFSTGISAGLGTTLSLVGVPAILSYKNPVPGWKQLYDNGKNISLTAITTSVLAGIWLYVAGNEKSSYLAISGLMASVVPYTLIVMLPVNNKLMAITDESVGQKEETRELVKKWRKMQWVRTLVGISSFLANIYITYWD